MRFQAHDRTSWCHDKPPRSTSQSYWSNMPRGEVANGMRSQRHCSIFIPMFSWTGTFPKKHQTILNHVIIRTRTHIYTHIYIYIHTYIHTFLPTYLPTYIPTYLPTYIHTYIASSAMFCSAAVRSCGVHRSSERHRQLVDLLQFQLWVRSAPKLLQQLQQRKSLDFSRTGLISTCICAHTYTYTYRYISSVYIYIFNIYIYVNLTRYNYYIYIYQ